MREVATPEKVHMMAADWRNMRRHFLEPVSVRHYPDSFATFLTTP
jgi:hypothetical protein